MKVDQVGRHIFYRRSGEAGAPSALTKPYAGEERRFAALERQMFKPEGSNVRA